ncbi:MAG TPA: HAMP domain-containing sensor histidine kinase, partial [Phycisphaerales bacterium]|nr:HAMP domain-containing sensor histidine kinase [Phycisphaerales bacterium]
ARLGELLARPDLGHELAADLAALSGPAEYLAQLTRGLRHFARDPEHGWDDPRTDLSAWRGEFEGLARTVIPGDVSLRLVLEDPLPVAAIPAHALTQAVFNLVHNAAEAVSAPAPRGPEALIEVRLDRAPDDGWFFLRVRDNGPGMSREVRERCLEPFFTTKARQKGTGLGLAMVHGIVRRAGGSIDVDSTPGLGTTFSLRLPACPTHPAEAAGCPCPAYVTLGDPRAQSLVEICLTSLGCLVASTPPNGSPGPALWVADAAAAREDELRAFLSRGPNRRLVAVNGRPEAAAPGLTVLTPGASFGDLRRTVQEAALALRRLERERESSR